ncbi:Bud-site selection protein [Xylariomycetidae sp. FL2044]|nr:Bud-site selection protein [Xylariomycetidae sp. FL2044]
MPKRKRSYEPSLQDKIAQWQKELVRGMKTAKGFERQRLSKRLRDADPEKTARLEREIMVLKSLDLQQAAHAHLCSSLLKVKGVAESPKLPETIKHISKPELSEEERTALHNVTSALCNRKHVKDIIEEAVMGTCIALRVPMPEKKGKAKTGKNNLGRDEKEDQADDRNGQDDAGEEKAEGGEDFEEPVLLRRKVESVEDLRELADDEDHDDEEPDALDDQEFDGFSDSDAEERAFARYNDFVAGSSSEEEDEGFRDDDEEASLDIRAGALRRLPPDLDSDISMSSEGPTLANQDEDDDDDDSASDSDSDAIAPPPKKSRIKASSSSGPLTAGSSAFLPTLMGGYISGSESEASDVDVAPPARKNRRGQRARQAIWEKKYGEKAKHKEKEKNSRDQGWDMRRGAVGGGGGDESSNAAGPWKKGIQNPFEKSDIHPDRQRQMQRQQQQQDLTVDKGGQQKGQNRRERRDQQLGRVREERTTAKPKRERKPEPEPKPAGLKERDDTGPLHPSWEAAKNAKREGEKVQFQGRKVVFD